MSIPLSNAIPETVPDGSNSDEVKTFLTQVKLVVEELASKGLYVNSSVKASAPASTDEMEDLEMRPYDNGAGTQGIAVKHNGTVRYFGVTNA